MGAFLRSCRQHLLHAGGFSFFINLFLLAVPLYTLQVFDRVFSSRSMETLALLTLLTLVALAAMAALDVLRARLLLAAGVTLDRALGPRVIAGLVEEVPLGSGVGNDLGLRDVAALRAYLTGPGIIALFDAPWAPVFTLVAFLFHPLLGAIALFGAMALFTLAWLNSRLTRKPGEEMVERARVAGRFITASVRNAESIRALGMVEIVTRRWFTQNERVIEAQVRSSSRSSALMGVTKFTRLLVQVLSMGAGAYLVIRQQVTSGAMVATTLILARALGPVEAAIATWRSLLDARAAYRRLEALVQRRQTETTSVALPAPQGAMKLEGVVLTLVRGEQPVLKSVSFDLAPGEALGIIGPSGAGKSSLARVMAGIFKPNAGAARLDGADVSSWDHAELARYLGYLPQAVELFPGTVGENIARLAIDAGDGVVEAAQRAQCHEMILRLPRGYDTEVGEGGGLISPGQRQRIALARALYGEPRFVILDEPNSNLDGEGEEALGRALAALKEDAVTVCIISHRPSLLGSVDKLVVLNAGRVEMFGPRAEIMARVTRVSPGATAMPRGPQVVSGGADGLAFKQG